MIFKLFLIFIFLHIFLCKKLIDINDKRDLKKELKSHSNILILFYDTEPLGSNVFKLISDLSDTAQKIAKVLAVNCKVSKKLCKQYKVDTSTFVIQHFQKGKFNKVYDRKLRSESLMRFLEDPTGDIPWEEEDSAKDVIHASSAQELQKIVEAHKTRIPPLMIVFYTPWCGYCKKMKPEFAAAATAMKGRTIFIGINGDIPSTEDLKQAFNVSGYPSIFLVREGSKIYKYESDNSKESMIKFIDNPISTSKPKDIPWSEETSEIDFLTDYNFHDFVSQHESVLVIFYAPWCGHCKAIKPEVLAAVEQLKKSGNPGRIAAVDSTEQRNISNFFNISGFPTIKYFKYGQYQYDIVERTADGFVKFMDDPKKPQEPEKELPWNEQVSAVHHPSVGDFKGLIKAHKHSLVMFYAPWCGHCKKSKPGFTAAADELKDNPKVAFIAVDCTIPENIALCKSENVDGFPTLRYYNYGKITPHSEYPLERQQEDFVAFMTDPVNPKLDARRHWKHVTGNEAVAVLDTETFSENVISQPSGALIMFYAPWCVHCNEMKPAFVRAAQSLKQSLPSCILGSVDATAESKLGVQYEINGFPTLIYFSPNGDWIKYSGNRNERDLVDFMHKKDDEIKSAEKELKRIEKEKEERLEKLKIEEQERKKQEIIKKDLEEKRRLESEKREKEEIERKQKELEKEKKRLEAERRENEEIERKQIELKKHEEETKRLEAEKKKKEEIERIQKELENEKEKKRLDAERREKEEVEKKQMELKKQEEEVKRLEAEKTKTEEIERIQKELQKEEEIKRLESEKNQRELEKKEREDEISRKEVEKIKKEEEEKKNLDVERKKSEEFERQKESEKKEKVKDTPTKSDAQHLIVIDNGNVFEEKLSSSSRCVIYFHQGDKKSHIRLKVVRFLEKYSADHEPIMSFSIDCSALVDLCDDLGVVDFPSMFTYVHSEQVASLTKSWTEDDIKKVITTSTRDEL